MNIRIQYKLFLAMLAVACGVVACMFLVMRWSFNRGFLDYVNKADLERVESLAEVLEEAYAGEGSWKFLGRPPTLAPPAPGISAGPVPGTSSAGISRRGRSRRDAISTAAAKAARRQAG